jgi:hypothetical protein
MAQHATTGSIAGSVADSTGAAVPGAIVTVTAQQGAKVVVTDQEGRFRAPYLTPGRYDVQVSLDGFQTVVRHNVDVRLAQRVNLHFTLSAGTFTGSLEVTGTSPVIDLSSAAVGLGLDSEFLSQVPVGRRLSETLYLTPGVTSSGGAGPENPSISGASGLENQYVVDGVNITDPRYGALGVFSSAYGSLGNGVTYDFVEEVQVRTAGAEAEFEQSTGGVVNVITKSGSNEHHGSVFAYASPESLEGNREFITLENGAVNTTGEQRSELGFTLGGPLLQDRIFYFIAANYQRLETSFIAPEGFPLYELGSVERRRETLSYAAKATFSLSNSHRIEASLFGDPSDSDDGPQGEDPMRSDDTGAFSALEYGGHNQMVGYQGILSTSWLIEASAARAESYFTERPVVDEWTVQDRTTIPTTTTGGKGRFERDNEGETLQFRAKSTHLLGNHEIRYGASIEDMDYTSFRDYTGPPITLSNGERTVSGVQVTVLSDPVYDRIYRVTRGNMYRDRTSSNEHLGLFAQDRIDIGGRLTISAGLRYEQQRIEGNSGGFTFDDNWAPRVAVIYDPKGRGNMKLFGSYGTFFARIPNNIALALFRGGGRLLRADYFDAGLTDPVPEGVEALGTTQHLVLAGENAAGVDPGAGVTYIHEAAVGFEFEALSDLSLGIRYTYRDMPRVLEDISNAAMVLYFSGDVEGLEYYVTNPERGYPATIDDVGAFEDPVHRYDSVELTANKRFADRWTMLASYRWSQLDGTYEGFYRNDTGRSSPAMTGLFDFPTNDPSYTAIGVPVYGFSGDIRHLGDPGPLPNDRTHQLKVHGAYTFDIGVNLGAGLFVSSGRPLTPMAANPVYDRPGDIPEAPRGSGIETEDGFKDRTPTVYSLDLHADYALPVGPGRLAFIVDVFNVFDENRVTDYDQNTEIGYLRSNPYFGRRTAYQNPREVRLAVRYEF